MNRRGAFIAYTITIVSAVLYLSAGSIGFGYYGYSSFDTNFLLRTVLSSVGVGGMVIGPYFGVAALLVKKDESVWRRVHALIHEHISLPFISGLALTWGGLSPGSFPTPVYQGMIVYYTVFVFLATVVTYMGSRDASQTTASPGQNM